MQQYMETPRLTTIFVANNAGDYPGFADALRAAVAFSNTRVISISNRDMGIGEHVCIEPYLDKIQWFVDEWAMWKGHPLHMWAYRCMNRWLIMSQYVKDAGITGPLFTPDWDVLIFRDLHESYPHFCHVPITIYGCVYHVNDHAFFAEYERALREALSDNENSPEPFNDMNLWERIGLRKLILTRPVNGFLVDVNMHVPQGCVMTDEIMWQDKPSKKLEWINKKPHVIAKDTQELVKVVSIHCWGAYKNMTSELLQKAGVST